MLSINLPNSVETSNWRKKNKKPKSNYEKKMKINVKAIRNASFILGIFLVVSCKNEATTTVIATEPDIEADAQSPEYSKELLVGSWKDNSESALDFTLFEDGTAQSDNMKTMLYKSWKLDGNQVTFTIESIGNQTSSIDDQTYTIEKLTENELVLKDGTYVTEFTKK